MRPSRYQVVIDGEIDQWCAATFAPADVAVGGGQTRITTGAIDQAALHGILTRLADLRLTLLRVTCVEPNG